LRIVSGRWGGRVLETPRGRDHRPTQARVREALFSRLQGRLTGATVVDLFAGCGALGFEALSRGAARAVFVERARPALAALQANVEALQAPAMTRIVAGDVFEFLAGRHGRVTDVGVLVADPPYGTAAPGFAQRVATCPALDWRTAALLVIEASTRERPPDPPEGWRRWPPRDYGETRLTIDERESEPRGSEERESDDE
jgi:16S rRNA (guanine966-N2)-methyltransferase